MSAICRMCVKALQYARLTNVRYYDACLMHASEMQTNNV